MDSERESHRDEVIAKAREIIAAQESMPITKGHPQLRALEQELADLDAYEARHPR